MSLDTFSKTAPLPQVVAAPTRDDQKVIDARKRARARTAQSGRRSTLLGGTSGGSETVARKTLLGE